MSSCEILIDGEPYYDCNESDDLSSTSTGDDEGFFLGDIDMRDADGALSALLDEFDDKAELSSRSTKQYPPMVLILQHFEVYLSKDTVEKMAVVMSDFYFKYRSNVKTDVYVSSIKRLYSEVRETIGKDAFDRVSRQLRKGVMTMALGLAPSFDLRSRNCRKCGGRRVLHLFCPECGMLFDIKHDLCEEMNLSKPSVKLPQMKRKRESSTHLLSDEIRIQRVKIFKRRCNRAGMAGIV